jgi:hypothetical protein
MYFPHDGVVYWVINQTEGHMATKLIFVVSETIHASGDRPETSIWRRAFGRRDEVEHAIREDALEFDDRFKDFDDVECPDDDPIAYHYTHSVDGGLTKVWEVEELEVDL